MAVPPEIFDEDYLYFYEEILGDERSDADVEVVARLLDLQPGMRVVDVPCGHGRIAGRLAARGCDVVGIDATERFIALAREPYPDVRFEVGDMRELAYQGEVDRVRYDAVEGRSHTERFVVRDGEVRKLEFSLEQVPAPVLVERLRGAGFADVVLFGAGGAPCEPEGPRLIAVAQRAR